MKYNLLFIILFFTLLSCSSNYFTHYHTFMSTLPMYGNYDKPPEVREIDKKFINSAIDQFGSADSASNAYSLIGWNYMHKGDLETAIKRFNQAWLLDSSKAGPYFGFSGYLEIKEELGTKNIYEMGLEYDYNDFYKMGKRRDNNFKSEIIYLHNMAILFNNSPNKKRTISLCNRILEIDPNDKLAYTLRGYSYNHLEEWNKSIDDLKKSLELGGIKHYLYFTYDKLGFSYMNIGNNSLALDYYKKSIELNPNFLYPLFRSSVIYFEMGKYDKALYYVNRCLEIKGNEKQFIELKEKILHKIN